MMCLDDGVINDLKLEKNERNFPTGGPVDFFLITAKGCLTDQRTKMHRAKKPDAGHCSPCPAPGLLFRVHGFLPITKKIIF